MVLPSGETFMRELARFSRMFAQQPGSVNAQSGDLVTLLAALVEGGVSVDSIHAYTLVDGCIRMQKRGDAAVLDHIITMVADRCKQHFGRFHRQHDETWFEATPPSGSREWQTTRARQLCSDLNIFGRQPTLDMKATTQDTMTTADGWTYSFASKTWVRNTLRLGRFRIVGKTRAECQAIGDTLDALISTMWTTIHANEAAGGTTLNGDTPEARAALEATAAVAAHPDGVWFGKLAEACNDDLDMAIYLVKQATRVLAGLSFVELLILFGAPRSGKDTFVNALTEFLNVEAYNGAVGWAGSGPNGYFTAPATRRSDPQEGHNANTHSLNKLRLVVLPEVPELPLVIYKERLEGTSHARAGHSRQGESQQVSLDNLWLMHGNSRPIMARPQDSAQVDRVNPVHMPLQFGDLGDSAAAYWVVPEPFRRQEDPQVKIATIRGDYAAELFSHCRHARQCLLNGARKIEPRPNAVILATRELTVSSHVTNIHTMMTRFIETYLEVRTTWVESAVEVLQYAARQFLFNQGFEPGSQQLGSCIGDLNSAHLPGAPHGTPSNFPVWGRNTRRGTMPCIKKRLAGNNWTRYGLNAAGRGLAFDAMTAQANRNGDPLPPAPITDDEIAAMHAEGPTALPPLRFLAIAQDCA